MSCTISVSENMQRLPMRYGAQLPRCCRDSAARTQALTLGTGLDLLLQVAGNRPQAASTSGSRVDGSAVSPPGKPEGDQLFAVPWAWAARLTANGFHRRPATSSDTPSANPV